MNALFAAGLFDSPWIVAALLIGSALVNWLSKRRQEKQARKESQGDEPSPPSSAPPGEFNLEETLRRLIGEESPPPPPVPPLIPRTARGGLPPVRTWPEKESLPLEPAQPPARPTVPISAPAMSMPQVSVPLTEAGAETKPAERRFETLGRRASLPATVVTHTRHRPSRSAPQGAARWRNPLSVRQAFVAALVFAPPKSLEP